MSDSSGKPGSSLAIAEKKTTTHRSGGCVGIFFQLFDWNRRFAKKKLFSMKLLPPARTKQTSKKFKGNEKKTTSKLHLITDENEGGFPKMKKNAKNGGDSEHNSYETRSPGLVARLMGLESMPVAREKPRKGSLSELCDNEKRVVNSVNGNETVDVNTDMGSVKLDSRPQKLQKTGQSESRTVTRFGPETSFQIKNVLSRTRKHYHHHNNHPKFVTPVKSPRIPSGKNVSRTSRLIDVATRILEPGLQSSSKRCALTHTNSLHYHCPNDDTLNERMAIRAEEQIDYAPVYNNDDTADSLRAQASCESCGTYLDVDGDSAVYSSFCSGYANNCSAERTGRTEPRMPQSPVGRNRGETYDRQVIERKFLRSEGLAPWPSSSLPCGFRRAQMHNQMSLGRDRTPPRTNSRPNNVETRRVSSAMNSVRGTTKDFVSLNRNVNSRTRPRVPIEKRASNGREEAPPHMRSPVRKRTASVGCQIESRGFVTSSTLKPRNAQCNSVIGRGEFGQTGHTDNCNHAKSRPSTNNSNGVISFTFNSPIRQRPGSLLATEKKAMGDEIKMSCGKQSSLEGDFIAALLEQKLKELTSQGDDESVTGRSPKKSTAMILQELISALTAERPDLALASSAETKHERSASVLNMTDHLSPGSVLEASFSSSSLDDSSGHRLLTDSIDYSSDQQLNYLGLDYSILDSACSSRKGTGGFERTVVLVTTVSRVLDTINLAGGRLTEIELSHAKEVVMNAELLFGNTQLHRLDGLERLFLGPILLELEAIANIAWTNINILTGSDPTKSGNQYRGFLFDCLIECLERKYGHYPNSGFRAWKRLPSCVDRETIIGDVENEMKKWTRFVGMFTDEIVDWEMSHGLGKWADFDIEAFEIGSEACDEILESLVDETLIGLW